MPAAKTGDDRIHLFLGTDEAKAKEAALKLAEKLAPKNDEFGLEIVNGAAENSDHVVRIIGQTIEAIQTMPFFGGSKLVWLQGVNFFGDNVTGKSETTLRAVDSFLSVLRSGLPPDVTLIIQATEMDKRRTFFKQIGKIARVEAFDAVDISKEGWEGKIIGWARKEATRLGMRFAPGALERFILTVGADTRTLRSELEKLSLYFGGDEIAESDVAAMVAPTHQGVIFEIGDALTRRDLPRTVDLIERRLRAGENAIGIMRAAIIPKIRGLLHAKDLVSRHNLSARGNFRSFEAQLQRLPEAETAHLQRKKDGTISAYPLFLSAQAADRFTVAELLRALEACLEADLRLVTTPLDPGLVLCQLVAKILAR